MVLKNGNVVVIGIPKSPEDSGLRVRRICGHVTSTRNVCKERMIVFGGLANVWEKQNMKALLVLVFSTLPSPLKTRIFQLILIIGGLYQGRN